MIHVSNLKKTFDSVDALKGISFHIPQGECYGLCSPLGTPESLWLRSIFDKI